MQNKVKFISKEAADIFMVPTVKKACKWTAYNKRPSFGTIYAIMNM